MHVLEGIKIIELVHMPPGELCSMILGDFGADIIKVEAVPAASGRKLIDPAEAEALKSFMAYNAVNRNKKSIRLNLKSEDGKQVFYKLAQQADVVIEGFRPGVAGRMGVDYATINKLNPRSYTVPSADTGRTAPTARTRDTISTISP